MRFLSLWIVLYVANAKCDNTTDKQFLDLNNGEDNAFLWQNLFIKLNNVLSETAKLNQNLVDVNKRFDELRKRQESQENHLMELTSVMQKLRMDGKVSQQWTTIQRRQDGSVDFFRNWNDYKNGFGNPLGDFFIGLERLHQMTTNASPQELSIVLTDFENQTRYAKYDLFRIGSEAEKYAIVELGAYTGDANDGMTHHKGQPFSTYDQDNNKGTIKATDCPAKSKGAWWFSDYCYSGHLNGPYRQANDSKTWGISWHPWRGWNVSMKYAAMMIRPKL